MRPGGLLRANRSANGRLRAANAAAALAVLVLLVVLAELRAERDAGLPGMCFVASCSGFSHRLFSIPRQAISITSNRSSRSNNPTMRTEHSRKRSK